VKLIRANATQLFQQKNTCVTSENILKLYIFRPKTFVLINFDFDLIFRFDIELKTGFEEQ
jgi:hypothetical protein